MCRACRRSRSREQAALVGQGHLVVLHFADEHGRADADLVAVAQAAAAGDPGLVDVRPVAAVEVLDIDRAAGAADRELGVAARARDVVHPDLALRAAPDQVAAVRFQRDLDPAHCHEFCHGYADRGHLPVARLSSIDRKKARPLPLRPRFLTEFGDLRLRRRERLPMPIHRGKLRRLGEFRGLDAIEGARQAVRGPGRAGRACRNGTADSPTQG
jgi:hypothetical protein